MRKRFLKTAISLSLAVSLVLSEVGTVSATELLPDTTEQVVEEADTSSEEYEETTEIYEVDTESTEAQTEETTEDEDIQEETEPVTEEVMEETVEINDDVYEEGEQEDVVTAQDVETANISNLTVNYNYSKYSASSLYIGASGYADRYDIYINNKLYGTSSDNQYYCSKEAYITLVPGVTYTVKVIPYNSDGVAGNALTKSVTINKESVEITNIYTEKRVTGTGFNVPCISMYFRGYVPNGASLEFYRSTSENGKFTKVDTYYGTISEGTYYSDYDVDLGQTYYYYAVVNYGMPNDGYTPKVVTNKTSVVKTSVANLGKGYIYTDLNENNNVILSFGTTADSSKNTANYTSGYEIYRSLKRSSGYKKLSTVVATTYEDKTVEENQTYYYKVRPYFYNKKNGKTYYGKYSEPSGVKYILGYINLNGKQRGKTSANITWDNIVGASDYEIYSKTDLTGDGWKQIANTTKTSFTKGGLDAKSGYYFMVRACKKINGVNTYYSSSSVYVKVGIKAPSVLISKRSYAYKNGALTVKTTISWDKIYGIKGYRLEKYDDKTNTWKKVKTLKSTATKYVISNVKKADTTSYFQYRLVAYDKNDEYYGWVSYNLGLKNVSKVNVKKVPAKNKVTISWKAIPGATSYTVYRTNGLGNNVTVGQTNKTSIDDFGYTPGIDYTYEVIPYNDKLNVSGDSYYGVDSRYKTITTVAGNPVIMSAVNIQAGQASIVIDDYDGAQKYIIYRSTNAKSGFKKIATTKSPVYTDKKVSKNKTYYYKVMVQGKNDAGFAFKTKLSSAKAVKIIK